MKAIPKKASAAAAVVTLLLTTACSAPAQSSGDQGQSYKDTKTMVMDILKSDEAMQQLQQSSGKSSSFRLLASEQGGQIQETVKNVLTGSDGVKLIEETFTDPAFAASFAKALQTQNTQLQKDLMKDPEYQKELIQLMKDPEYTKIVENVIKGQQFRLTMMTVMKESLSSPMFRAQLVEMMGEAIEQETKPKSANQLKATEQKPSGDKGGGSEGGQEENNQQGQGQSGSSS
ncbi:spore germination lipoprotein GerD [Gorillibacterium timonense]|uniref:spore germination lipoprotein GerD n=1 Tax=Gorillibacterium timonense TaxID=1689269 RepID=UPI00071D7F13|nr:spore germination lipoprotein GerD [Gorillibacterium timonense]